MRLTEADYWSRVKKLPGRGCWLWTGAIDADGYGTFRGEGAHRWAVRLSGRDLPSNLNALHKCDRPFCVRPDHLYVGTDSDNRRDFCARGMLNSQRVDLRAPLDYTPNRRAMYRRRRNHGLVIDAAAAKIGVTPHLLNRWERGTSIPSEEQRLAWIKALPMRRARGYIFGLKGDPDLLAHDEDVERRRKERQTRAAALEKKR